MRYNQHAGHRTRPIRSSVQQVDNSTNDSTTIQRSIFLWVEGRSRRALTYIFILRPSTLVAYVWSALRLYTPGGRHRRKYHAALCAEWVVVAALCPEGLLDVQRIDAIILEGMLLCISTPNRVSPRCGGVWACVGIREVVAPNRYSMPNCSSIRKGKSR